MNNEPKVSVILPMYNEPVEWVVECLESLINQTFQQFEIIAILDNPNNYTLINLLNEYKKKDERIIFKINEVNLGLPTSLNEAIKICKGKIIARIDADDICFPNRLELQYEYLNNNKNIDLIGGNFIKIDENGNVLEEKIKRVMQHKSIIKYLKFGQPMAHPTWMGKTYVFKTLNYNNLLSVEDMDFLCRAVLQGYKLANIPEVIIKYRVRQLSLSRKNSLKQIIYTRYIGKVYKQALLKSKEYSVKKISDFHISQENIKCYERAEECFAKLVVDLKSNNYFKAVLKIPQALLSSKYFQYKIIRRIMLNLIISKEKSN